MKFILEVNNKTPQKVTKKIFLGVFSDTLKKVSFDCLNNKTIELSVAMVNLEEIRALNFQYRKKNSPTDVLSFSEYATTQDICKFAKDEKNKTIFLGEIILCPAYIARNAKEDGESFDYALNYIISHGILHLLGFPHGKKMFALQKAVADNQK